MSTIEVMGDKRPENKPGVYRHPDGHEIETASGSFGKIQADAIVQQGYVWVSDKPKKTIETPKK